jgi:hypothetical protein
MWWVKYTSNVAFFALLFAYGATLLVGWSWAQAVPFVDPQSQAALLNASLTVLIIAAPIWLLHWIWASKSWVWESKTAQYYLAFFTIISLGAAVVIALQLIFRLLNIFTGQGEYTFENSSQFLFGAAWSVAWSLAVWAYHGFTWLKYRERRKLASNPPQPEPAPGR